jgi:SAM-dependent methyltransferase
MAEPEQRFDPRAFWEARLQRPDLAAVGYSGLGLGYNRWLYRVRSFTFRRILRAARLDLRAARVLDVGSGTGFYVAEWLRAGTERVTGSDLTDVATARLGGAFPGVEFVRFDVSDEPPFPSGAFDAISAFDVLFHIVDDARYESAVAHLASLLRDGGYLFCSENFVHGRSVRLEHQVSRSLDAIEGLLSRAGFEIVLRRPMFVLMNAPLDSRSRILHRSWRTIRSLVSRHEALGSLVGALLFPVELLLVSALPEGPSTEIVVCRKVRARAGYDRAE